MSQIHAYIKNRKRSMGRKLPLNIRTLVTPGKRGKRNEGGRVGLLVTSYQHFLSSQIRMSREVKTLGLSTLELLYNREF